MNSFDIHRGVPLISRAVLVARLRELERNGVVERQFRVDERGHEYRFAPAWEAFRPAVNALAVWGMAQTYDRIQASDRDPALLMWGFRKRVDPSALPKRRVVLRFEFSGVPASRTKFRIMWLVLEPADVDVCVKDPGFDVDVTLRGNMRDWIAVFWGRARWRDLVGTVLEAEGDLTIVRQVPTLLHFDMFSGRKSPVSSAGTR